jgi:hypothetical protein
MNEILLLKGNPSKRRKSRKHRSAAQKAATLRLIAFNRNSPKKRRKASKASGRFFNKATPISRRKSRGITRKATRRGRSISRMGGGVVGLLKTGAIAGGGALVADVGMGLVQKFLPSMASLTSRVNADGSINYTYYATKGALIYAMGKYGARVTRHAPLMASGALAVMAYELFKSFMPADGSIPLGYFNPGRIAQGGALGRIMRSPSGTPALTNARGMGRIIPLSAGAGKGAIASATVRNLGTARR